MLKLNHLLKSLPSISNKKNLNHEVSEHSQTYIYFNPIGNRI